MGHSLKGYGMTKTAHQWAIECAYISNTTDRKGMVSEMNNDTPTFIWYCEMQRDAATREGFHDSASYIQHCINDLKGYGMFAVITDDHTGETLMVRELKDNELLHNVTFAHEYAASVGRDVAPADGYIPTGCADFTVTLQDEPGSVRCWNSQSYFFNEE